MYRFIAAIQPLLLGRVWISTYAESLDDMCQREKTPLLISNKYALVHSLHKLEQLRFSLAVLEDGKFDLKLYCDTARIN